MKKKIVFCLLLFILTVVILSCDDECKHLSMTKNTTDADCNNGGYTTYYCDNCDFSYVSEYTDPLKHRLTKTSVAPTCTTEGYTNYSCQCGYSYKSDIISPTGHDYKARVVSPTCIEEGYTVYTCSTCSDSYTSDYTDATGHTLSSNVVSPDCKNEGYTVFSCSCGHSYRSNFTPPLGHYFEFTVTAPTCTEQGYTAYVCNCGYSYIADYVKPDGHKYSENIISIADCINSGCVEYTCKCGDTYSLITPPLQHSFKREVTAPTLSDIGFTDFICQKCNYSYQGDYKFYSDIVSSAFADSTEVLHKGIDISYHNYSVNSQGEYLPLDFNAIKKSGIDYVIIRIGDAAIGIDPTFEKSYADAKAAGLDVGAYFYTRATTTDEILREANLVLSALDGKKFEYPIYLDLEDDSLSSLSAEDINELCFAFYTRLQRSGYYTGLYVNHEWLYNIIDTDTALSKFEIWYARYPSTAEGGTPSWDPELYGENLGMWQYTDSGYIDGIDGVRFDFNYSYKDYPSIIKDGGFNGFESDLKFPDTGKAFVWIIYNGTLNIRSSCDYFTLEEYDSSLDIVGFAKYSDRFEVVEANEKYTTILYNGNVAYISANPTYISFTGLE